MKNMYNEYCMNFTTEELKKYLIEDLKHNSKFNNEIRLLTEDGEEIKNELTEKIGTIVFDKEENLFINFMGIQTSIFIFDKEIMFIDEYSKNTYTSSDVQYNAVYEGELRDMTHIQMLNMFSDIILSFNDADGIEIIQLDISEIGKYRKYNYFEPHEFIINVKNNHLVKQTKCYQNIRINY